MNHETQNSDPRTVYADIIDMPRPEPKTRPRMPLYKRAAQFAPFAALAGYSDMVDEEIRETEVSHKRELNEDEERKLNQKLNRIITLTEAGEHPTVSITYYEPDATKAGGRYVTITDAVKRVDIVNRVIELMSMDGFLNRVVNIDQIYEIFAGRNTEAYG